MVEIKAPFVVNIDVTNRCNLHCKYCYSADREAIDIPKKECIALINELIGKYGVFHVTIAGGEPLCHPEILDILSEGFSRYGERIALLSNGTMLNNDQFFEKFAKVCRELDYKKKRIDLQISIDSHNPDINDKQRDRGKQVIESIERALSLPINLQLACVVTKNNVHCADEIIETYYPRIKNFHYMNVMPSKGRTTGSKYWDLLPSNKEIQAFHKRILNLEKVYHPVRITKIEREKEKEGGSLCANGCLAGTTRIDIAPDLKVFACCMSDEMLGDLTEQTFDEMWQSHKANQIREMTTPYCFKWADPLLKKVV